MLPLEFASPDGRDASPGTRPQIFADSPAMRQTLEHARRAAETQAAVLITGEHGSGRHMIAREIHHLSAGPRAPLVRVDCSVDLDLDHVIFGAVPTPTVPPERRGVERVGRAGALCRAQGGTLLVSNATDLPTRLQTRLARVLRDREVVLAESRRTAPLALRPILVADGAWQTDLAEGRLRSDLFRRFRATHIHVPPLRNRREDIPGLAAALLQAACAERRLPTKGIDSAAMSLLAALPWRGNARELIILLHNVAAQLQDHLLRLEDVLAAVHLDGAAKTFTSADTLKEAKERFERDYITAALERHHGRIGDAARALGIQRPNLYRKMRTLHLPRPRNPAPSVDARADPGSA